jgi:S1-C subfamily serine protease
MKKLIACLALLTAVGCSSPPKPVPPPPADPVVTMQSKTVALVEESEGLDALLAQVNGEPSARAYCTGVWVDRSLILTARHCTGEAEVGDESIRYTTYERVFQDDSHRPALRISALPARLNAVDEEHDLALLGTMGVFDHGIAKVTESPVRVGEHVFQIGQSLGLWWSFSSGDVAAERWLDTGDITCLFVQTTTPTSPGNSGGGLYNDRGELVGIAHASTVKGQNLNFFVHPSHIRAFLAKHKI